MRVVSLTTVSSDQLETLTRQTHAAAATHAPNWLPKLDDAREELADAMKEGHVSPVLLDGEQPLAWGSIVRVHSRVWELHPLIVSPEHQRRGCGATTGVRLSRAGA